MIVSESQIIKQWKLGYELGCALVNLLMSGVSKRKQTKLALLNVASHHIQNEIVNLNKEEN